LELQQGGGHWSYSEWNIWLEYVYDVQEFTGVSEIELQTVELAREIGFDKIEQISMVGPLELHGDELTEDVYLSWTIEG
jgi:hypothetical protein